MIKHLFGLTLLWTLGAGCHVQVDDQELFLKHDSAGDRLALVFSHRGIASDQPKKGMLEIESMLDGKRMIGLAWPFYVDLEKHVADWPREDRYLAAGVRVLDHGLFLDQEQRLCGYQHIVIEGIAGVLARVNELFNTVIVEELDLPSEAEPVSPDDDSQAQSGDYPRSQQRWITAANADWTWLALVEGSLVVRIPVDPADVGRLTNELLREYGQGMDDDGFGVAGIRGLLQAMSRIQLTDSVLELTFAPDEEGVIAFRFEDQVKDTWDPALYEAILASESWPLATTQSNEELRALLFTE